MPRSAKKAPGVRADGEVTAGAALDPTTGQPNGRAPRGAITQAAAGAGAGAPMPYGEKTDLQGDAVQTQPPPGVSPAAHAAAQAMKKYKPQVTPLFAPTQRPWEHVTAGAPMAPGPTNPMAMPTLGGAGISVAAILEQAAAASQSPTLRALAAQANAVSGSSLQTGNPFASTPPVG